MMKYNQSYLNDKVFEICSGDSTQSNQQNFRYVHLKIKKISNMINDGNVIKLKARRNSLKKEESILIQIIDVSHKLLYGEAKAE